MGRYFNCEGMQAKGKAKFLMEKYNAICIHLDKTTFVDLPDDKALVVVSDNGPFEAAAYLHSLSEFLEFANPNHTTRKTWLVIDKKIAEEFAL